MAISVQQPVSSPDPTYGIAVADEVIERTAEALRAKGFAVQVVDDRDAAKAAILAIIPDGAEVNGGASRTLEELGVKAEIEASGRYDALRPRLWAMDRATQMREIRKLGAAPDFFVNSVNAVTEDGRLVLASWSGSQLGPIAGGAGKVVLAVGAQKIVADLEGALRRIEEYCLPLEDASVFARFGMHSALNKVLIVNADFPERTTVILVREAVGV